MRVKIIFVFTIFISLSYVLCAQVSSVTISGIVKEKTTNIALAYVNVVAKTEKDSLFITAVSYTHLTLPTNREV